MYLNSHFSSNITSLTQGLLVPQHTDKFQQTSSTGFIISFLCLNSSGASTTRGLGTVTIFMPASKCLESRTKTIKQNQNKKHSLWN